MGGGGFGRLTESLRAIITVVLQELSASVSVSESASSSHVSAGAVFFCRGAALVSCSMESLSNDETRARDDVEVMMLLVRCVDEEIVGHLVA